MTLSLMSCPRMRAGAILAALPVRMREEQQIRTYRDYVARCARLVSENTAKAVGGSYVGVELGDLAFGRTKETRGSEEVIAYMKGKLAGFERQNPGDGVKEG